MREWLIKHCRGMVMLVCFVVFRTSVADWNPVPSGSMRPTILEGDVVLVNRAAYDLKLPLSDFSLVRLANPQRGDVVTFTSPKDGVRLIKRVVGLPGDVLALRNEVLWVNGTATQYSDLHDESEPLANSTVRAVTVTEAFSHGSHDVQFLPSVQAMRNFGPVAVPADSYFMLGDNRDDSADSRYIGFVPRHLLIGKAHHIILSANILGNWMPRLQRFGQRIP